MNATVLIGTVVLMLVWGVWGITTKLAIRDIGLQILVWGQVASLAMFPLYFIFFKDLLPLKIQGGSIFWAVASGVLGTSGTLILYLLQRAAPASIAIPLSALYPAVTVALAFLLLREEITPQQWLGIILALAAIALLTIDFNQFFSRT